MKKMLMLAMWVLLYGNAVAQFSIKASVVDGKTNAALAGATIKIAERIYVTNESGYAEIINLPAGMYEVEVKFLGYSTHKRTLTLFQDEILQLVLEETAQFTDEVIVYATRINEKSPLTYSNLNKPEIQKQNFGQDLPFLLNWMPSVVTTSDAGAGIGYTGIRIRGSDATRINVTINGIPYNDSESLGTFWVDIPDIASSSQSIQVQRGVGTSTNGAGAFGASINLQTTTLNREPYAEVVNSAGSFNTHRHTVSVGTGLLNNHWSFDGRVSRIMSDGYIDRASSNLKSYFFSGGFHGKKTIVKAIVFGGSERTYQSWYGVPESRLNNDIEAMEITAMNEDWNLDQLAHLKNSNSRTFNIYTYKNEVDDYKQDHYQLHFSHRANRFLTFNTALHYTYGRGFYEQYRYDDDFENYGLNSITIDNEEVTSSDIIRRRWLDNDFYGVTYSVNYEKEKFNTVIGGAWNRYEGDHYGEIIWADITEVPLGYRYYFNRGDKQDFNVFAKVNYQLSSKFSAFADLQYRRITYEAAGKENKQFDFALDETFNFFNPKVGVTYQIGDGQQTYASFSVANREPVRDDFVDNFNEYSSDPEKKPMHETLYNYEIGYRGVIGTFTLQANYYFMQYKNQLVLTGKLNDVGASVRTNVDDSYRMGVEVEGLWSIIRNKLLWSANVAVSRNKIKEFTEVLYDYGPAWDEFNVVENTYKNPDISFSPQVILGSSFSYLPFRNAEISLLSKYVGRQYLDNTSNEDRSISPYLIHDIRAKYAVQPNFMREISLSLICNNIFSEEYESNGYTYGYLGGGDAYRENFYYPQAGRNFLIMLTLKF
jgi:iron complex outermembrane recepter protein